VSEFREKYPIEEGWSIETLIFAPDDPVVVKAAVCHNGDIVATGYAEERRDSSQINRTSALENCETSAIGRALAAAGFGGSEYASANEVQNAIQQQASPPAREKTQNHSETESLGTLDIPSHWKDAAREDYREILHQGVEAYGQTEFSDRIVRLLTHGDYGTNKIAGINFKQDGHRLFDAITNMLEKHKELEE
jgi:hypothetical protein